MELAPVLGFADSITSESVRDGQKPKKGSFLWGISHKKDPSNNPRMVLLCYLRIVRVLDRTDAKIFSHWESAPPRRPSTIPMKNTFDARRACSKLVPATSQVKQSAAIQEAIATFTVISNYEGHRCPCRERCPDGKSQTDESDFSCADCRPKKTLRNSEGFDRAVETTA